MPTCPINIIMNYNTLQKNYLYLKIKSTNWSLNDWKYKKVIFYVKVFNIVFFYRNTCFIEKLNRGL